MKNTPTKGSVKMIVFYDQNEELWFGVALEFNIVVSASDQKEALALLSEAVDDYVKTVRLVKGLRDLSCLNQKPIEEYAKLWQLIQEQASIPSPYLVAFHGEKTIYA